MLSKGFMENPWLIYSWRDLKNFGKENVHWHSKIYIYKKRLPNRIFVPYTVYGGSYWNVEIVFICLLCWQFMAMGVRSEGRKQHSFGEKWTNAEEQLLLDRVRQLGLVIVVLVVKQTRLLLSCFILVWLQSKPNYCYVYFH